MVVSRIMEKDAYPRSKRKYTIPRVILKRVPSFVVLLSLVSLIIYSKAWTHITETANFGRSVSRQQRENDARKSAPYPYEERGAFMTYPTTGYDNGGKPGGAAHGKNLTCSELSVVSEIGVQKPWDLDDDLSKVAQELDDHPMVYYTAKSTAQIPSTFSLKHIIDQSWDRLAGSCVLLPDRGVYLCITRVIFHDDGRKDHCQISFLRGQIFDRSWVHMDNYILNWKGRDIVFPRIFDTGTEFVEGGEVYGPEDPRIIIEEGVKDAEPVIIFNMISEKAEWKRAMWIFRPFSQYSTILTVEGEPRREKEKNWEPLFVQDVDQIVVDGDVEPRKFLHFVYGFQPLQIIKCGLVDGICKRVFTQDVPQDLESHHKNEFSELRGGTQWIPVPLFDHGATVSKEGVQAFVAFPRTHTERTTYCHIAVYRPELTVMVTNGTSFYLTYVSSPMDFGLGTLLDYSAFMDPCKEGRIIIVNSIAQWDLHAQTAYTHDVDVMTLTLTVNDATVQAMRISGVLKLIRGLPSIKNLIANPGDPFGISSKHRKASSVALDPFVDHSAVGLDVRSCAEEDMRGYIDEHTDPKNKEVLREAAKDLARGVAEALARKAAAALDAAAH